MSVGIGPSIRIRRAAVMKGALRPARLGNTE